MLRVLSPSPVASPRSARSFTPSSLVTPDVALVRRDVDLADTAPMADAAELDRRADLEALHRLVEVRRSSVTTSLCEAPGAEQDDRVSASTTPATTKSPSFQWLVGVDIHSFFAVSIEELVDARVVARRRGARAGRRGR